MKNTLRRVLFAGAAFLAVSFLSGCALTKDYVSLGYVPQTNVVRVAGAESVPVTVTVKDVRAVKDKVSVKKNGYGMEMAAIIAKEDVAEILKSAIGVELNARGFRLDGGGVALVAELSKFYSDFKTGFWSGKAIAELTMNVQIRKRDGTIGFSKLVNGGGGKERIQLATGSNAKVALDAALRDAVSQLFADSEFIEALLKAGKT